ncbi:sensor histidine kinase [Amycolatopsis suaedae]|uniref:histidine kinase n=1 Tax=Amycolatopsis suaedae TaxID=2510978 RepID=A0A4Q7J130_9PSEU|nr:ATP-binding protein [Amycolatopsis suaedae]RZQ60529.1 sensor histidine kinase [Amycolatopsis suaedae]
MSSNRPDRRSLRTRLVAGQLGLVALVCAVVAVATLLALRAFLVGQLDTQLAEASHRGIVFVQHPGDGPLPPPPINAPGQRDGTVTGLLGSDGSVYDATRLTRGTGRAHVLDGAQIAALRDVPATGVPVTVDLPGLGSYRMLASTTVRGNVLVTGLPMSDTQDILLTVGLIMGGVMVSAMAIAAVAGTALVRRTLRPLHEVADTARRVTELPLHRGEVVLPARVGTAEPDPRTEVGQVAAALDRLLGHVGTALAARHASETRVRQFVADASHELRTPLAAIQGYAELAGRAERVPPDVAHAIGRITSESRRMGTLVADLLLLARLDAGRPVERAPVDVTRLVADAVGDARVAGPEHRWRLELPAEPVRVLGDQAQLHQVVANLLANARTHTPAGTAVTTRVSAVDGGIVLAVNDDGPGIPAHLLPEVFERFARGDGSRSRAAGSTGLGLAIVAAVVQAHGGVVTAASVPGRTTFTVALPHSQPAHSGGTTPPQGVPRPSGHDSHRTASRP